MLDKFKGELVDVVTKAVETDMLDDEDALAIIKICKRAADKKIASVTEQYLVEQITGVDKGGDADA